MSNPLTPQGAQPQKPTRFAPIFTSEFFTGLWTQRNPLRDAATPYLYAHFYNATRYESLINGSNVEISPRLTLTRRPGNSVYNSQSFSNVTRFYGFRLNSGNTETIRTVVDTTTTVYDGTGPSTKTLLYTKQTGAGKCSFLGVGNTLYMGDFAQAQKWVQSPNSWTASAVWTVGQFIVDPNNNLQKALGLSATITNIAISSAGILTVTCNNSFTVGDSIFFYGLTNATFLNGQTVTVASQSSTQFTATYPFGTSGYSSASDTGLATDPSRTGTAGTTQPTWPTTANALTLDGSNGWICRGSAVEKWGIVGPANPPNVGNAINGTFPQWQANTFYNPSLRIVDSNTNIQLLTTAGVAGASQPTWNTSTNGTTTDGTAVWTNQGSANRQTSHTYAVGQCIAVAYTIVIPPGRPGPGGLTGPRLPGATLNYDSIFQCSTAGTTNGNATASLNWGTAIGTQVTDGTVIWTNIGQSGTWLTVNDQTSLAGLSLSTVTQIVDSNGNLETCISPGLSQAAHPVWPATAGATVEEFGTTSGLIWLMGGSVTAANPQAWVYCYAFMNSVTGHISSASPLSPEIVKGTGQFIVVSGATSSDPQVDYIRLYRSTLGQTTPFQLVDILMPSGSTWSYNDNNPDTALNQLEEAAVDDANDPPPSASVHQAFHLNRIFVADGNTVFYSGGPDTLQGNGNEAFPPNNFFEYPSSVSRMWPSAYGLMVMTTNDIYIVTGQGTSSSALTSAIFEQGTGLLSEDCFDVNGSTPYMFTADHQLVSMDQASGLIEPGFPIGDQLANFSPSNSYIAWYINGDDKGLFIANGSTGWFRLNPTPAPETGYVWSPFATIAASSACGALACIETSPGTRSLLIGPVGTGPILKRDLTTTQDNGTNFTASATVGSIVLAVPSQVTMVEFIAADCLAIGSNVSISVLLNEVSGTFTSLSTSTNDPPGFASPASVYSNRWYLDQTQAPRECKHLQIEFSWPAENFANELLSFTIFGGFKQEL